MKEIKKVHHCFPPSYCRLVKNGIIIKTNNEY